VGGSGRGASDAARTLSGVPERLCAISEQPLTVGELFPADDEVAQWVFSLSVVVDDLHHITRQQKAELAGRADARTMLFLQRVLTIRLYEARKLVYSLDSRPAIAEFLRVKNVFLDQLRSLYLPIGNSAVDRLYGALRHHSVHYMWPGSDELESLLRTCSPLPARARIANGEIDLQWVPAVAGMATMGEVSAQGWMPKYEERGQAGAAIQQCWTMLYACVMAVYARHIGVPLERFNVVEHPDAESTPTTDR
jgi:hypothetical protein